MIQNLGLVTKWVDYWTVRDCLYHLSIDDRLLADLGADQVLASVWPALAPTTRECLGQAFVVYNLATGRV
jgi:hypothetical protein